MKRLFRYAILVPIGIIYMPVFALVLWMNPLDLYKDFFEYLKSGKSFGVFD